MSRLSITRSLSSAASSLLVLVLVLLVVVGLDRRQPFLAADAGAIERPAAPALVEPGQDDHVPHDPVQGEHARAVGLEVVEVRNDDHVDARLHQAARRQCPPRAAAWRELALWPCETTTAMRLAMRRISDCRFQIGLVIGAWSFIRHSDLDIRHLLVHLSLDRPLGHFPHAGQMFHITLRRRAATRRSLRFRTASRRRTCRR